MDTINRALAWADRETVFDSAWYEDMAAQIEDLSATEPEGSEALDPESFGDEPSR